MKKRKIKKRIIALYIGLLAVMVFSFIFISIAGDHYPLHTRIYFDSLTPDNVQFTIEDESVVKLDSILYENGELVANFTSLKEGKTTVTPVYSLGEETISPRQYTFEVSALGTIIDTTDGSLRFNGFQAIISAILAQLLMTEVIMIWLFVDYRKKGEFCYPMIACGGLAIYIGILFLYVVHYMIHDFIFSFTFFLMLVTNAGIIMLFGLMPIMLVLSVMLAVSNIWLMRNEGYRPVNALGIVFAVMWFLGTLLTDGANMFPFVHDLPFYDYILLPLVYIIGYMECMFISTAVCSFLATKYRPAPDRDYIIILGCAIRKDGTLTPLLKARVDRAVAFEKEQYEKTGKHAVFVPSGGQGPNEVISEGEAMENYLTSIGVPAEQISREDKSTNTYENMKFSKEVIDRHSENAEVNIAFSTTNYHVFRGYILARKNGYDAKGISAKTKIYFFPNAFLREFIGLLVDQKWKHILFIVLLAGIFTLLHLLS